MRRSIIDYPTKKGALWFHPLSALVLVACLVTTTPVPARAGVRGLATPYSGEMLAGPAVVYDRANTLHLFVRGTDGAVWHRARNTATVNQVVSRRMVKQQQIRWTQRSAHLLLQVRTQVLHEDLRGTCGCWYPGMQTGVTQEQEAA